MKDKVMVDFENINVISKREDVLFIKAWLHEYGYPIHVLGNRKKRKKFYNGWKNKTLYQLEDGAAGNTGIWIKYTKKYWP